MELIFILVAAVTSALVVGVIVVLVLRRQLGSRPVDERGVLREEQLRLEGRLAVEEEKSKRLPEIETARREAETLAAKIREEKASAERDLAASNSALTSATEMVARLEHEVAALRDQLKAKDTQLDVVRAEKGQVGQSLAVAGESVEQMKSAERDLRERLVLSDKATGEALGRIDTLTAQNTRLETTGADTSARLAERDEYLAALRKEVTADKEKGSAMEQQLSENRAQLASIQETLQQERKQAEEKLRLLAEARQQMSEQFRVLADEVLKQHGATFSQQNKEQLDGILTPLREKLKEFQQGLQLANTESTKERASLGEQIRALMETGAKMTTETLNLTRALKGKAQTQGAWGEMILTTILERSGLREGEEYVVQETQVAEDGTRARPDVVVNMPNGQRVVVDSKVSLTAFESYVNAASEGERTEALGRHMNSIRSHVKGLSGKEYQRHTDGSLDYVIMFVPIEGALAVALQEDPAFTLFAAELNVAIATPTTLMIALRTVANVWHVERRNRNAELIADRAGKLFDKFVGFLEDLKDVGARLENAQKSYEGAIGKLSTGRGNIVRQVEQLKELGAKVGKSLPSEFLGEDEDKELPTSAVAVALPGSDGS